MTDDVMAEAARMIHGWQDVEAAIQPLLKNHHPAVQGAVLADVVGRFFGGHHPDKREMLMRNWTKTVVQLIAMYDKQIMPNGWPKDGTGQ